MSRRRSSSDEGAASARRSPAAIGEMTREVADEIACVVLGAVNEGRFATPQYRQTDRVHPGGFGNDSAVMAQLALAIEHRHLEPAIVGTKSRSPDERADLATAQVERQARQLWCARWLKALRWSDVR